MQSSTVGTHMAVSLTVALTMVWAGLGKRRLEWKRRRNVNRRRRR